MHFTDSDKTADEVSQGKKCTYSTLKTIYQNMQSDS